MKPETLIALLSRQLAKPDNAFGIAEVKLLLLLFNESKDGGAVSFTYGEIAKRLKYKGLNTVRGAMKTLIDRGVVGASVQKGDKNGGAFRLRVRPARKRGRLPTRILKL